MNKLFDLRFVIGAFFTAVGFVLVVYGFLSHSDIALQNINRNCGGVFIVFGVIMLILSFVKPTINKN